MCGGGPWVRRPPPPSVATLGKAADVRDVQPGGNLDWRRAPERNTAGLKTIRLRTKNGIFTFVKFYYVKSSSEGLKPGLRCPRMFPKCPRSKKKKNGFFFSSACKIKSVTHLRTAPIECPSLLKFSWYRSAGRYSWKAHIPNMCILSEILGDHLILFSRPGLVVRSSR